MEVWLIWYMVLGFTLVFSSHGLNPACECLIYSATYGKEYGRFSSPDYPRTYPDDIDCLLYTFIAGSTEIVEINFRHFDLHPSQDGCLEGDYIRAYLDLDRAHLTDLTEATGILCSAVQSFPHLLYSSGPFLVLELHTSKRPKNANYSGFVGTFRFIDTSKYSMPGSSFGTCDYQIIQTGKSGQLYSPRYPSSYPRNSRCTYTISARDGGKVRLAFEEFDLQRGDHPCLTREDVLRIHDGPSPLSPVITILCNQGSNAEIISSGDTLYLEFSSTSHWPGHGFHANYYFVPRTEILEYSGIGPAVSATRSSCDVKLSSEVTINGSITSPGFPGHYPPGTSCQYEFTATGRQRVQLVFTDFSLFMPAQQPKDCEGVDSVVAYVVLDGRVEKIDSYCGVTVPRPIMSNGPRLLIHFIGVHSSRHARGFRAKYLFTANFGISGGEQVDDKPCAFRYRSTVAQTGHITSPNFPGLYPRDTECHYFFHGSTNQRLRLTFNYFDVEGVHPCDLASASDYVEFSNFMGLDRKYTRQCGQMASGLVVESERKFFRVTFRSNDRLDGTGFNATYQFVEQPTLPPTTVLPASRSTLAKNESYLFGLMMLIFFVS
ncbi:suppressor of lurcher protein 1-like isoform X2 [Cimex lectularius]|uniref:CUB domain-containing protein n=1 Tax=Cimex lectularius TaxID=79782 RepID=A0A8I6STJ9_CIMLE|nr:suppressor of lurcher protein 1-like isoform X2 [Cimex lectularius]